MKRTVLVYRIGQLGDTLISLPAIAEIQRRHPIDRLILLTEHYPENLKNVSSWEVLSHTGWFDEVVYYKPAQTAWQTVLTSVRLIMRLRRIKPDVIYDLAPERSPAQIRRDRAFFTHMVGVQEYFGGIPLPKHGKDRNGLLPRIEPEWKRLLGIVGVANEPVSFRLAIPEMARSTVADYFAKHGIESNLPLIAIGPGSKMPSKLWPLDRYRELGRQLLKANAEFRLIVLGDDEDARLGELLCRDWGTRAYNCAGIFSVYESAAALECCKGYVGNDTGTMHLAAMVGTPCVALFSARDYPGQWEPYGPGHIVLRHEIACAGCMLNVCKVRNNECLKRISVDQACAAVQHCFSGEATRRNSRLADKSLRR